MPDPEDALKITIVSPGSNEDQQFSLLPGESVYLGKGPQQPGPSITLGGATDRVSRTAAKITFQNDTVLVEHCPSASPNVVTEKFRCLPQGGGADLLRAGQQHTFYTPGRFEVPDAGGPHVVCLDFDAPASPSGGSRVTTNLNVEVWGEICRRAPARRTACLALVAAWFVEDFVLIPSETIPSNKLLALLCGEETPTAVIKRLANTRRFLDPRDEDVARAAISQRHRDRGQLVGRAFRDEYASGAVGWGNSKLAEWIMDVSRAADPRLITLADILELPGLANPTPAAAIELGRRGH